jgi:hypothetical protein
MSWECGSGDGWSGMLVGWLGVKALYVALGGYFLGWNSCQRLIASLADLCGALIGWWM